MRVLGIDPGLRNLGWGVIDVSGSRLKHVANGTCVSQGCDLGSRLVSLYEQLCEVLTKYQPDTAAVEKIFVNKDGAGTLKLGQARGAAICAAHQAGLEIAEYAPREIKQAIVGTGAANKDQVQHMVKRLRGSQQELQTDAADGLAIAICHAQFSASQQTTGIDPALLKRRRGRRR